MIRGSIEEVGAGQVTGWVDLEDNEADVLLVMDGEPFQNVRPHHIRTVDGVHGLIGFEAVAPSNAYDGMSHAFWLSVDGKILGSVVEWKPSYQFSVEKLTRHQARGWLYDEAAPHLAARFVIKVNGSSEYAICCKPRADVSQLTGALAAGFVFEHDEPIEIIEICPVENACPFPDGRLVPARDANPISDLKQLSRQIRESNTAQQPSDRILDALGEALRWLRQESIDRPLCIPADPATIGTERECAILVPVYEGFEELRDCLTSVNNTVPSTHRIILINDSSPNPDVAAYLEDFTCKRPLTELIENEQNLGFPMAVNKGFELLRPDEDVVVLNADTVVPEGWLSALQLWASAAPNVASVTPMSNNATILSYPRVNYDNPITNDEFRELSTRFSQIKLDPNNEEQRVVLPTAVGFCMYITADALSEVGYFGEEWGKGYAEEVDWCMRASDRGLIHLAAPNVFVLHHGSVSFGQAAREELSTINNARLSQKYPEFPLEVQSYIKRDPLREIRLSVDRERLVEDLRPTALHIVNGMQGGTARYVREVAADLSSFGIRSITIQPNKSEAPYDPCEEASYIIQDEASGIFCYVRFDELIELIDSFAVSTNSLYLHVHSTLNHDVNEIRELCRHVKSNGWRIMSTVHDYAWYCPRVQMLDSDKVFCGLPSVSECVKCIASGDLEYFKDPLEIPGGISGWTDIHDDILGLSSYVAAPSAACASYLKSRFPERNIVHQPHSDLGSAISINGYRGAAIPGDSIRACVIGAISIAKGFDVLCKFAKTIRDEGLPIELFVLGYTCNDDLLKGANPDVKISGAYKSEDAQNLLEQLNPDISLNLSIWPETYCYTVSEAWQAGVPVMSFDIGAQGERVKQVQPGLLIPFTTDTEVLAKRLVESVLNSRCDSATVEAQCDAEYIKALYDLTDDAAGSSDSARTFSHV